MVMWKIKKESSPTGRERESREITDLSGQKAESAVWWWPLLLRDVVSQQRSLVIVEIVHVVMQLHILQQIKHRCVC